MIKNKKLSKSTIAMLPKAAALLNALPSVQFAYLFGSLATGKATPLSDVDIAVYLNPADNIGERKLELLGRLIDTLQTDEIDLIILNRAPLPLRMQILKNNKVLVDKATFQRHIYESLTMREYFDFSFIEKGILKRRFLNG